MSSSPQAIRTVLTDFFGIKHPILLAGMGSTSGAQLAAAVTNVSINPIEQFTNRKLMMF